MLAEAAHGDGDGNGNGKNGVQLIVSQWQADGEKEEEKCSL
jgi:hypothetical protein